MYIMGDALHVYVHIYEGQTLISIVFFNNSNLIFWDRVIHWIWSSLVQPECLSSKPQSSSWLCLSNTCIMGMYYCYQLYINTVDMNTGSPACVAGTLPTDLATSPALIFTVTMIRLFSNYDNSIPFSIYFSLHLCLAKRHYHGRHWKGDFCMIPDPDQDL